MCVFSVCGGIRPFPVPIRLLKLPFKNRGDGGLTVLCSRFLLALLCTTLTSTKWTTGPARGRVGTRDSETVASYTLSGLWSSLTAGFHSVTPVTGVSAGTHCEVYVNVAGLVVPLCWMGSSS